MRKFKKTYIEITNICNLSCSFCPKTKRKSQFMDRALFERILMQIKNRTKFIYFHVMGEPLLHPELGLFLDLCHDYGFRVNITTNGTLIDKATENIITKPALRQVNFSLHSFEANECNITMDEYLNNIFTFIKKCIENTNIQICLRLWNLTEYGLNEENSYILKCIQKEFDPGFKIEDTLSPCNGIKLSENIFLNQSAKFEWPNDIKDDIKNYYDKGFCYGLREQIAFLVDGTVVPCCLDNEGIINLGNIGRDNLDDILGNYRAKDIYNGFSNLKVHEELCRKCTYRYRFNNRLKKT